jgi:hypothetical protein
MLEAPFQPGAAAFPDGGPHFFRREIAAAVPSQLDGQRGETIQIGGGAKPVEKRPIRQHKPDKAFQIFFAKHIRRHFAIISLKPPPEATPIKQSGFLTHRPIADEA